MHPVADKALQRAKRRDVAARWVVLFGGVATIASVIAIVVLIAGVTLPLFLPARIVALGRLHLPPDLRPEDVIAVGIERSPSGLWIGHMLVADGNCVFVDGLTQQVLARHRIPQARKSAARIVGAERHSGNRYSVVWSDGSVSLIEVRGLSDPRGAEGSRGPTVRCLADFPRADDLLFVAALVRQSPSGSTACVYLLSDNRLVVVRQVVTEDLLGEKQTRIQKVVLDTAGLGPVADLSMDRDGMVLYAGTRTGQLVRWQFDSEGGVRAREGITAFSDKRPITRLALLFGDVSLAVGDAWGEVTTWFAVRHDRSARLTRIHALATHDTPIRQLVPSSRGRLLLSLADDTIHIDHATSQRHLASLRMERTVHTAGLSAQGSAAIALDAGGELLVWEIRAPHPEISWRTLWGRVWYEGYDRPSYSWQTTGGDDFEPKLSLVPLVFGTAKGTAYAMLFAVPLALLGAIYTSYFTTPELQRWIKPVVEIMAAVPSVVIGFLVALWFAPLLERGLLALLTGLVTIPATLLAFLMGWQVLRGFSWAKRLERGYEFLVMMPVLLAGAGLALLLAPQLEAGFFGGDFRRWLYETLAVRYDQRNCVVIAFGLGFAVIPVIFSIAEDALSTVPYGLTAASLALGASRWQTLWRVVLPSASPGIFAAIMVGFGRAVGETMIVLMATGNTPILDPSPFNGMRTLSANIAVEIPEAPVGGTLYRVLFLCAVCLFLLTFLLNTAAEVVRQRLRRRFGRL